MDQQTGSGQTRQFENAGLVRCGDVERRIAPQLERFGLAGWWQLYVMRATDATEPAATCERTAQCPMPSGASSYDAELSAQGTVPAKTAAMVAAAGFADPSTLYRP